MTIRISVEDGIGRLVLDEPPLNILSQKLLGDLREELANLEAEKSLRVLVISAEGKHFSAGADVGEHLPPAYEQMIPEFIQTVAAIDSFPIPVIAAVKGRCLGGGFELAQAADMIVAGEGAMFGQPEILLGVLPPAACAVLPDMCAPGQAAEIVFSGEALNASQAQQAGIVLRVVPDDQVEAEALELANKISRHSAAALKVTKRALRVGFAERRAAAYSAVDKIYVNELMRTEDAVEGLQAFLDKRKPTWKHQ
jgi:cyclohexa-1,5-dienecarbonyl-CoA hydratase